MTQLSFSDVEFGAKRKQTRRDKFLAEMDKVVDVAELIATLDIIKAAVIEGELDTQIQAASGQLRSGFKR